MVTGEMIISYPAVFTPKENLSGQLKYSCSLLVDKKDTKTVKELKAAIDKAIEKGKSTIWGGKVPPFRYEPLRDGDAELENGSKDDPAYKGRYFLNCTSNDAPGIVGADAKPLMDQTKLFAGCIVRADISAFAYKNSGNNGVAWGLNNIMLVREGKRLDGRSTAEDAFSEYASDSEYSDEVPY